MLIFVFCRYERRDPAYNSTDSSKFTSNEFLFARSKYQSTISKSQTNSQLLLLKLHPSFQIISQQTTDQELLSVSVILYNHSKEHVKSLNDVDFDLKIRSGKVNIVLMYKHINQLLVCHSTPTVQNSLVSVRSFDRNLLIS